MESRLIISFIHSFRDSCTRMQSAFMPALGTPPIGARRGRGMAGRGKALPGLCQGEGKGRAPSLRRPMLPCWAGGMLAAWPAGPAGPPCHAGELGCPASHRLAFSLPLRASPRAPLAPLCCPGAAAVADAAAGCRRGDDSFVSLVPPGSRVHGSVARPTRSTPSQRHMATYVMEVENAQCLCCCRC